MHVKYPSIWYLRPSQWLAAEFNIPQTTTFTSIEGYMSLPNTTFNHSGYVTMAIYGGTAFTADSPPRAIPANNQLYFERFFADSTSGWYGPTVDWALSPGDYWVAFEIRSGDTYDGAMSKYTPRESANENIAYYPPRLWSLDGRYHWVRLNFKSEW